MASFARSCNILQCTFIKTFKTFIVLVISLLVLYVNMNNSYSENYSKKTSQSKLDNLSLDSLFFVDSNDTEEVELALSHSNEISKGKSTSGIPNWVNCTYVKNGPGSFNLNKRTVNHIFDGQAMIHKFKFENGKVFYTAKFVELNDMSKLKNRKNCFTLMFAQKRKAVKFSSRDGQSVVMTNPDINLHTINGKLVALGETPLPVIVSLKTLNSVDVLDYADTFPKRKIIELAHAKKDFDETIYNLYIDYGIFSSEYVVYKICKNTESRVPIAKIKTKMPSYMHDFAMTRDYIVLVAYPFITDIKKLITAQCFLETNDWRESLGTTFYIVSKKDGSVRKYHSKKAAFAFHHINAYEKDGKITLYTTEYRNSDVIFNVNKYPVIEDSGQLVKYEFDLKKSFSKRFSAKNEFVKCTVKNDESKNYSVKRQVVQNSIYEFPIVSRDLYSKEFSYFYGVLWQKNSKNAPLVKYNVKTNKCVVWQEDFVLCSEPMFIKNPNGTDEDDGLLISIVLNQKSKKNYLIVLDAKTMKLICRYFIPNKIAITLHGLLISGEEIQ